MGTYLSTPVVEKGEESGDALDCPVSPLAWGVVDMQGWRKSMEDAHVAQTDVEVPPHLYADEEHIGNAKVFGVFDGHGGPEVARFCQLYTVDVLVKEPTWMEEDPSRTDTKDPASSHVGRALIAAFHALDRMIDDKSRRDELIRLRSEKPGPGERRTTDSNPIPPILDPVTKQPLGPKASSTLTVQPDSQMTQTNEKKTEDELSTDSANPPSPAAEDASESKEPETENQQSIEGNPDNGEAADDDSNEAVGKEEAAEMDRDMLDEGNSADVNQPDDDQAAKVTEALQQQGLDINGDEKQVIVVDMSEEGQSDVTEYPPSTGASPKAAQGPSLVTPTVIQNGRQICNLPDHPIHAGCTAVVAVLIGRTLTVANAGDSRAVLCRMGGRAEALSFDHKPHQDREMSRITKAGGFVNQFGRVNGNLNLSRSIGDLKYKQIPGLTPAEQMITAEPDIIQVTLHPKDEFVVIGCDGIWDCLTNDQAVKYVRDRIDSKTPTEIGAEMLDEIISEDPRATQGIGGDNMTIMIVDLQPHKRAYR